MPDLSKKFRVLLTPDLRAEFEAMVRKKSLGTAKIRRATVLLMADEAHSEGGFHDWEIAEEVGLCERQIVRIRQKFVKAGPQSTLTRAIRSDAGVRRTLDGRAEAAVHHDRLQHGTRGPRPLDAADAVRRTAAAQNREVRLLRNGTTNAQKNKLRPWAAERFCIAEADHPHESSHRWKKSSTSTKRRTTTAAR